MEFKWRCRIPRGTQLVAEANALTALYPAYLLQLCVCQETGVAPDSIDTAFTMTPPYSLSFVQPPLFSREHLPPPAQPYRIVSTRAYRMTYRTVAPSVINPIAVGGFNLVNLDPAVDAGVAAWIGVQGLAPALLATIRQCVANIKWPVYQQFIYGGGTVHFFTWHAPLMANWLGAILVV